MEELGITEDLITESARETLLMSKLKDYVVKDVAVTDEEIQAEFDSRVESAKTNYQTNLSSYGSSVNNGTTVYYAPAGYRYVKHILRAFPEETKTAISDLTTQITAKTTEIANLDTSIADLGEDAAADNEEKAALLAQKEQAETEKAALEQELSDTQAAAYEALTPVAEEILAKIAAGEDFDSLMEEYGEDPGMQSSPKKETGYVVCEGFTSFDPAFTEAAMSLANIGDTTGAVQGQSGIHIIKYVGDVAEGPVALDTVKDTISATLLTTKQNEAYTAQMEGWVADSNAVIDRNALKD